MSILFVQLHTMKIDWTTALAVAIGTILASAISRLLLDKLVNKVAGHLESTFENFDDND